MNKFDIKSRYTGQIIYSGDGETLAAVIVEAVAKGVNLRDAYLGGADLRGANLRGANLGGANLGDAYLRDAYLGGADLGGANLGGANLGDANLRDAYLRDAYLGGANLGGANLGGANLGDANLRDAYLRDAYLRGADLGGANLGGANLRYANLRDAYLGGADLGGADLGGANLGGANLRGVNLREDFPFHLFKICPEGSIVGWKKLACGNILRLEIPADAKRLNAIGSRKCRAEYAIVCGLYTKSGELIDNAPGPLCSRHDGAYTYTIGQECRPNRFDDNVREECSNGIHFFITFEEARDY
jgi:uncharacterized protein YjbI with pentapeptide repeats